MRLRPRRGAPGAPPSAPSPASPSPAAVLDTLGAVRFSPCFGAWAYMLFEDEARERPFYAGMSEHLVLRLGEHHDSHGERLRDIWVIPCRDAHSARVTQLLLIDRFEAQLINVLGTSQYERLRNQAQGTAKYLDSPLHVTRRQRAPSMPS